MNDCKDDSNKNLPAIKNSLTKYLIYLEKAFERINDNSNPISLTQGKGSEDGFIDVIFGEILKIICDYPLIPIPRFDVTNEVSNYDYKNQIILVIDKDALKKSFEDNFKTKIKKSYDRFKMERVSV